MNAEFCTSYPVAFAGMLYAIGAILVLLATAAGTWLDRVMDYTRRSIYQDEHWDGALSDLEALGSVVHILWIAGAGIMLTAVVHILRGAGVL